MIEEVNQGVRSSRVWAGEGVRLDTFEGVGGGGGMRRVWLGRGGRRLGLGGVGGRRLGGERGARLRVAAGRWCFVAPGSCRSSIHAPSTIPKTRTRVDRRSATHQSGMCHDNTLIRCRRTWQFWMRNRLSSSSWLNTDSSWLGSGGGDGGSRQGGGQGRAGGSGGRLGLVCMCQTLRQRGRPAATADPTRCDHTATVRPGSAHAPPHAPPMHPHMQPPCTSPCTPRPPPGP